MSEDNSYSLFKSFAEPLFSPWLCDENFLQIDSEYAEWLPDVMKPGRYLQYVLAKQAVLLIKGDFIECGVYQGKSASIFSSILDKHDKYNKELFLIDSYEGLDSPTEEDKDIRTKKPFFTKGGVKGHDVNTIKNKLNKHRCSINFIKGWIPDTFENIKNKTFSFAHIDVDLYQSTYDSLFFVYPRMEKGGIILFDDYGFPMCTGARKAIDDFLLDKIEPLIPLPSGQALLIKSPC
ncbi:MAG: 8-demethyl-8-(2,3-dimethoxy-alpha-L-rhamnosyl)-tetracenomycin-C 4'-O-methyltransferase [Candidatus Anoxychlamydiales bacterium]|nr:8-demethyl-8-(2,3-dimethoxy-alpha-L-rhamnosyl)-tetracenomycin-C 4'-O-methyltransferase [Candidatus Anoxychlamydiales bacterium]NGX35219.1 8-demethyl-8-(2,3-dimethoxy-alpha-L-rhamnosyl)-tetracenomycin-C 4'-O-methyltransferase [Candidatus Anoxychlamydiales bacterium]